MSFIKRVGRTYLWIGKGIIGAETIADGAKIIRNQCAGIRALKNPRCPVCGRGQLFPVGKVDGVDYSHLVGCSQCAHYQPAELNEADKRKLRVSLQSAVSNDREAIVNRYKFESRVSYVFALVCFAIAIFFVIGENGSETIWATMISAVCLCKGVTSAYRCWQIQNQRFFEDDLFGRWFAAGRFWV